MRLRGYLVAFVALVFAAGLVGQDLTSVQAQVSGNRFFPDTGFTIADDAFWDYFQKRGGVETFGQPVSRKFLFLGAEVQFFQRLVMQRRANGSVTTLNLLDEGLMPVTRINGSTFPAPDPELIASAPVPSDPAYGVKMVQFVEENAPDRWNDLPVNFFQTFNSVVSFSDAFPDGSGDPGLLPLLNLEIWGAPTSAPAFDPANHNFVYQRFQRVIAHYDRGCDCTRALLLADWFKSVLPGRDLPSDLEAEMRGTRFYRQYDLSKPNGVARPDELPATNMLFAFEREDRPIPTVPTPATTATPSEGAAEPTATPEDAGGVEIVNTELAQDPVSRHWIGFGEVRNVSSNVLDVYVKMNVFNADGQPMAIKEERAGVTPLGPGQTGTFRIDFGRQDPGVDHQTTEVRSVISNEPVVSGLRIAERRSSSDDQYFVVTGVVQNRSGDDVRDVVVGVAFYDEDGALLDVWQDAPVFDWIEDDEEVPFEASTRLVDPGLVDRYTVYATAIRGRPEPAWEEDDAIAVRNTQVSSSEGLLTIRGEVQSDDDDEAREAIVAAVFYDRDDQVTAAGAARPIPRIVVPSGTAPFEMEVAAPPDGYDRVEFTVLNRKAGDEETWPQPLRLASSSVEREDDRTIVRGRLENDTSHDLHEAFVVVAFYDSSGDVVDVASEDLDEPDIDEDDVSEFTVDSDAEDVDSVSIWGYGYR